MSSDRVDWVEIIEPKTKEHMYANLTTGECVWDPPEGVNVKRTDSSQWWELFDNNTHRFYYYNATTQTTVWHRPIDCDIIPLAKLQTLKQNTDPQQRRETSTQTNSSQSGPGPQVLNKGEGFSNGIGGASKGGFVNSRHASQTQTSPLQTKRSHHHRCSGESRRCGGNAATGSGPGGAMCRHTDSGRSSDSSISSAAQPYRRLQEAGLAIPVPLHKPPDSRVGSESGSMSRVPPSTSTPQLKKKNPASPHSHHHHHPPQDAQSEKWPLHTTGLNRSGSFMSPRKDASDDSMHEKYFKSVESTPLTRRKVKQNSATVDSSSETSPQSPESPQAHSGVQQSQSQTQIPARAVPSPSPHQPPSAITHPQVPARPSLVSSISLATEHPSHNPHSHPTHQQSLDRIGHRHRDRDRERDRTSHQYHLERGARERFSDRHIDKDRVDERLLERNLERTYPSEKQALYNVDKGFRQTSLDYRHTSASQSSTPHSKTQSIPPTSINWHAPKDMTRKQQAEPEKPSKQNSTTKQSCSTPDSHSSKSSYHHQEPHSTSGAGFALKSLALEPYLTKPNIDRHNMEIERERERNRDRATNDNGDTEQRKKGPRKQKVASAMDTLESGSGCENGNTSPLYSNWDLHMQHLLPLQHYILEQAKLSACYRTGEDDPLGAEGEGDGAGSGDSDSLRSSGSGSGSSARSLSGHEPDNEDSDRSGSNDGYLQHHPPPAPITHHHRDDEYMNHGVSYYNTFIGFEKDTHPTGVHRSASGTGIGFTPNSGPVPGMPLQAVCEALYSPVKSHPALHHTPKETDIEKFAQDNLNLHSKGIFRKKASVRDMLSWTSSGISGPMLGARRDKAHKKAAAEIFRLVQIYMGDRKARPGMTLNSVAIDVLQAAYSNPALRDELYVQLCRQTTENPQRDSLLRGWELLAVSLAFVPPSPAFQPPLLNYMNRHRDPAFADTFPEVGKWPIHVQVSHYAGVACRRLERIGQCGKKQPRKPNTEDIDQARIQIFRSSMFGNTLGEVMILQKDRFPNRQLPWIQVALSQQVLALQGKQTEGIFRVSADVDEVNTLKSRLDNWELPDHFQITDAHAPASLLKLWYRELYEPLIPDTLYAECVADPDNTQNAIDIVQRLPRLNRIVLTYLVGFLQQFSTPEVVLQTKMDSANLAMVFAPNCLRCTSQDPRVILDNARKEMTFMKCLILNMDTQQVRDML